MFLGVSSRTGFFHLKVLKPRKAGIQRHGKGKRRSQASALDPKRTRFEGFDQLRSLRSALPSAAFLHPLAAKQTLGLALVNASEGCHSGQQPQGGTTYSLNCGKRTDLTSAGAIIAKVLAS